MKHLALALALSFTLGCTGPKQVLIVSGQSLYAAGEQFTAASEAFRTLCTSRTLAEPTCDAWAAFQTRFKLGYNAAISGWEIAALNGEQLPSDAWTNLLKELAQFTLIIINRPAADPGVQLPAPLEGT